MDVTCDKCRTEYEFDESLISESGTTVKCTNCGYLFRIYRPGTPDSKRRGAWMLRQPDGSVYTFERMTTLQRWIAEGKVSKDDMVSRTGEGWQALGSMQELVPFFRTAQAVLSAKGLEGSWTDEEEGPTLRIPPPRRGQEAGRPEGSAGRPEPTRDPPRAPPPRPPSEPPAIKRPMAPVPKAPKAPEPLGAAPTAQPKAAAPSQPPKGAAPSQPPKAAPVAPPAKAPEPPPAAPAPQPTVPPAEAAPPPAQPVAAATLAGLPVREPGSEPANPQPKEGWSEGALLDNQAPAWAAAAKDKEPLISSDQEPAWTSGRISQINPQKEPDETPPPRSRLIKIGVPVLVVALVAGIGVGTYVVFPDLFRDLAGEIVTVGGDQNDSADDAYGLGREQFLLDTTEGFRQADREYHRADANNGLVQAGLAEVYTTWSQYDLDDVEDARLRAQKADPSKAVEFETRAKIQEEEFHRKLEQAHRFVEAALKRAPESVEAHRSAADYYRLAGDLELAKQHITTALEHGASTPDAMPETEYVKALVDLSVDGDVAAAVNRLEGIIKGNDTLIRCHYRLARLRAAMGDRAKAVGNLEKIVALNAQHERAPELLEALRGTEPVLIAVTSPGSRPEPIEAADAGPDAEAGPTPTVAPPADAGAAPAPAPTVATAPVEEPFDAMVRRATKLQDSGGASEACALFRRADKVRPGNAEVLVGLGYCAMDSGSSSQAASFFQRALRGNGNYGPALIALAQMYRRQGNASQALEYYRRYLQTNSAGPDAAMARQNVARLEEQLNQATQQAQGDGGSPQQTEEPPPSGDEPPAQPPPQGEPATGTPENPTVTRITEDHSPPPRSDSLTTGSEPPLRPGENLE